MDIQKVAKLTLIEATQLDNPGQQSENGVGLSHAAWMLHQIYKGEVAGEKAHRWIGWAQCMLTSSDVAPQYRLTLGQCKKINIDCID